jgi:serine protease
VYFDSISTLHDVSVTNLGGGLLAVGPVTATTDSGGPWLAAVLSGTADATRTASAVRLTVDRGSLPAGNYFGTVTVALNGGTVDVRVTMSVGVSQPPPPNVFITVRAVRSDTGVVVQQTSVNPTTTLAWRFATLPTGSYYFLAATDLDGNGVSCEDGDYCGAYPRLGQLKPVSILPSTERPAIDFSVFPSSSLSTR